MSDEAIAVPFDEQKQRAREHYDRISREAGDWSSFVRDAIEAVQPAPESPQSDGLREGARRHTDECETWPENCCIPSCGASILASEPTAESLT